MTRIIVLMLLVPMAGFAQIRMEKLEVKAKEKFRIVQTDILVVDTLVLNDSSVIELNRQKKNNYIHAKHLIARKGSKITGVGTRGDRGKDGLKGHTVDGPCIDGTPGQGGTGGAHGEDGVNLYLYVNQLTITGSLIIDLRGADGGDGGSGGAGGGGSMGTRVCVGGTGGIGGGGGNGGNGGNGGMVTMSCKNCPDLRGLLGEQLLVRNYAGFGGLGGEPGSGGLAGLGAQGMTSKDGKIGPRGKRGNDGTTGKQGAINFERD